MAEEKKGRRGATGQSLPGVLAMEGTTIDKVEPHKLVDAVKALFKRSEEYKSRHLTPGWLENLYFYLGWQNIGYNGKKRRWYPQLIAPDCRSVVNLYRSKVNTISASDFSTKMVMSCDPRTATAEGREAARLNERVLRYINDEGRFNFERARMAHQKALYGGSFGKVLYDPTWGRRERVPEFVMDAMGQVVFDPETGQPQETGEYDYLPPPGQVRIEVRSPFEMHVPASARSPQVERIAWIGEKRAISVDEIYRVWKIDVEPDPTAIDIGARISMDIARFFDPEQPFDFDESMADAAWVRELHYQPDDMKGFEEGRKIVIIDDKVVENEAGDLPSGRLPYFYCPLLFVDGRFHGDTPASDMKEPQRAYNKGRGLLGLGRTTYSHPWVVIDENAVDIDQLASGGRVVRILNGTQPGNAINFPDTGKISSAVVEDVRESKADLQDSAGLSQFTQGQVVGSSPQPYSTVQALIEADRSDLALGNAASQEALGVAGELELEFAAEHYKTPRIATISDETDNPEVFEFNKTDITPGTRVRVKLTPELSILRDSMRTQFVEALKTGELAPVMQDPSGMSYFLEMFEMPTANNFLSLGQLDVSDEERELTMMLRGEEVHRGPFDDDETRLKVIARFTKTAEWKPLAEDIKQRIMMHAGEHQQELMKKMAAMQPPPGAPQPTPSGGGGGPQAPQ